MMDLLEWFFSTLRFAAPLLIVAMGGILSERSGVINIALEGLILWGAFAAASTAYATGNPWLALFAGATSGAIVAALYAFLTVSLRADQIVSGTAINLLAWGGIPFLGKFLFDSTSGTPPLDLSARLTPETAIIAAVIVVVVVHWLLKHTQFGLYLTFAGEKPQALKSVGVSVVATRFAAVMLAGFLAGFGGSILSIVLSSSYTRNMSAGRGFMALAAIILGKWKPIPTAGAAILFGFCEVLQLRLQGVVFEPMGEIPVQLVQIIPYALTLVILGGFIGESRAPSSLGQAKT